MGAARSRANGAQDHNPHNPAALFQTFANSSGRPQFQGAQGRQVPQLREQDVHDNFWNLTGQKPKEALDVVRFRELFPTIFTLVIFMIFLWPMCAMLRLDGDATVQYWITGGFPSLTLLTMIIPIVFIVTHVIHTRRKGAPSKYAIVACLLIPSILLLLLSNVILSISYEKADQLASTDCEQSMLKEKVKLQQEWLVAYEAFKGCLDSTVKRHSNVLTLTTGFQLYRLQDCEEYPVLIAEHQAAWTYLRKLEDSVACSGWCAAMTPPPAVAAPISGPALWTFSATTDSCSQAVAQIFKNNIRRLALQVAVYTLVVVLFGGISLLYVGPYLRSHNLPW